MSTARHLDLPMPSEEERQYVGAGNFKEIGDDFLQLFTRLGGLKPSHDVLDVGCGIGRMALAMVNYLEPTSRFEGFDIVKHGIDWCEKNISTRWPNFNFKHSDIYNKCYNESGRQVSRKYKFPYGDNSFDFAFLTSVFTHMLPRDMENYLGEIHRVLRPGGKAFITFFITNAEVQGLISQGKSAFKLQHHRGPARIEYPHCPEQVVGYEEKYLHQLFKESGFGNEITVFPGQWCGRSKGETSHDLVLAVKSSEPSSKQIWRRKIASWMPF
ncbi:MAG: class I SAM-dependent methyltransferase [Planctomycetes bacterium]|nr:class I SAM-dependent methyltransferase [Planctomycetota bacterium]NBY01885.1 class I SAM-dependent methyltransferase [Planctomycetota bacterium]